MSDQAALAASFRALHVPGSPLVLFNVWDAGSAQAVASAGAKALATGSWSVAAANGFADGEALPLDLALANLRRIVGTTELPVTIDSESGYGVDPEAVGRSVEAAIESGAVGCNIEDSLPGVGSLRPVAESAARLAAARRAAERTDVRLFINARTDLFLEAPSSRHDQTLAESALGRAMAYSDVGADGLFVPGLLDERLTGWLVDRSPLPVNVMVGDGTPPLPELVRIGVARVSHGPGPYRFVMSVLAEAARKALAASGAQGSGGVEPLFGANVEQ